MGAWFQLRMFDTIHDSLHQKSALHQSQRSALSLPCWKFMALAAFRGLCCISAVLPHMSPGLERYWLSSFCLALKIACRLQPSNDFLSANKPSVLNLITTLNSTRFWCLTNTKFMTQQSNHEKNTLLLLKPFYIILSFLKTTIICILFEQSLLAVISLNMITMHLFIRACFCLLARKWSPQFASKQICLHPTIYTHRNYAT